MTESGSETRQRTARHSVRLTPIEDALLLAMANAAGVKPATFLRCTALGFPFPRQARRPTTNKQDVVRVLSALGKATDAFERASSLMDPVDAAIGRNDLAEMRLLCFSALGRKP